MLKWSCGLHLGMMTILPLDKLWRLGFGLVFFCKKNAKTFQQLPVAGRKKMRIIMTLIYLKKKDVWQLAHSYQESNIQSYLCVGKWKDPPQKPWKVMESVCASRGSTVLWLWHQWERVHRSLSISFQLINIQQYCRKATWEKNRQRLSGQPVESTYWKGTERLVNIFIRVI